MSTGRGELRLKRRTGKAVTNVNCDAAKDLCIIQGATGDAQRNMAVIVTLDIDLLTDDAMSR